MAESKIRASKIWIVTTKGRSKKHEKIVVCPAKTEPTHVDGEKVRNKECHGRMIGQYNHAHNCIQRSGKCCSIHRDGQNATSAAEAMRTNRGYCGYCWTKGPTVSHSEF